MRIIFMGTPNFAAPILNALINHASYQVVAVYTKPPVISGRGMKLLKSPVHILAENHNIPIITPKTLRNDEILKELKQSNADVIVVAAYGLILPLSVLEATKYGCINIHPSDLPRWRGAAPIQRTIMAGDKQTAMCIMRMDEGLDTGDVISRTAVDIPAGMTANELSIFMADLGAQKLLEVLHTLCNNTAFFLKQPAERVTYAHKLTKEEELIDWTRSAEEICWQIKALSPKPGAYFRFNNEIIKIIDAEVEYTERTEKAGTIIDDTLSIACGQWILKPTLLQREGRKMLYTDAFLRGYVLKKGMSVQI